MLFLPRSRGIEGLIATCSSLRSWKSMTLIVSFLVRWLLFLGTNKNMKTRPWSLRHCQPRKDTLVALLESVAIEAPDEIRENKFLPCRLRTNVSAPGWTRCRGHRRGKKSWSCSMNSINRVTGKIAKVMTNQGIEPWFPQPQCGVLTTVRISHFSLCSANEYYTIYIMIATS